MITPEECFWLRLLKADDGIPNELNALNRALETADIGWQELGRRAEEDWGFSFLTNPEVFALDNAPPESLPREIIALTDHDDNRYLLCRRLANWEDITEEWAYAYQPALTTPALWKQFEKLRELAIPKTLTTEPSDEESSFLDECLYRILQSRASDWHLEAKDCGYLSRLRIDGELSKENYISPAIAHRLVQSIRIAAKIPLEKVAYGQEGQFEKPQLNLSIRVVIIPSIYGPELILRLLPREHRPIPLIELGMEPHVEKKLISHIKNKNAILLCAGATGSGKSTTIRNLIQLYLRENAKVVSIEDPVEVTLSGITQVEVCEATGVQFANTARAFLRQSPDTIYIGEIRDSETAAIAQEASLCGHRVLSTIHSGSIQGVYHRLADLNFSLDTAYANPLAILLQRLIPKPCQNCSERPLEFCSKCNNTRKYGRTGHFKWESFSSDKPIP